VTEAVTEAFHRTVDEGTERLGRSTSSLLATGAVGGVDVSVGIFAMLNVALILIAFVFPTQLVSSVFGYLARDSVAGTGMAILAGTWLTVGLVMRTSPAGATSKALAVFLVVAGVAMLVPALGALGSKLLPAAVLTTTALRFFVTAGYQWTAANGWKTAAGVVGLFLGALAVYAALAIELEEARGHSVLPAGRRGKGAAATRGLLADQLEGLEHAPGVRRQL
jgi:succinate-acetate transporter protein